MLTAGIVALRSMFGYSICQDIQSLVKSRHYKDVSVAAIGQKRRAVVPLYNSASFSISLVTFVHQ